MEQTSLFLSLARPSAPTNDNLRNGLFPLPLASPENLFHGKVFVVEAFGSVEGETSQSMYY